MKLPHYPKSFLFSKICLLLVLNLFAISIVHANENLYDQCFTKDYKFSCPDPNLFLQNMGIEINNNIIRMADLYRIDDKELGCHKGSFYADKNEIEYFVKPGKILREFIGGKLLNRILPQNSAIIKVIQDQKFMIASKRINNFIRLKEIDFDENIKLVDEVILDIAMDFLGIIDRSKRNMGCIPLNNNNYLAVRVD
ncbi:MAG: hypothetical protein C5B43_01130, partial [Verrucomicrobia bacterium]